jgi:hypothetical protein
MRRSIRGWSAWLMAGWLLSLPPVVARMDASEPLQTTSPCSANCTIQSGRSFSVLFDASVVDATHGAATGYRLYIDNTKVGPDLAASPGTTTIPNQILTTPGEHTIEVSAFNASGEGAKTPPLKVTITVPLPGTPTNLRILVAFSVAENGSVSVKVVGIEPGVP